jgi:hypothetical protein
VNADKRLGVARETLAGLEAKIGELANRRRARLLAGDDAPAIDRLDDELARLQRQASTERDRIKLLIAQAEEEERKAIAKRKAATIARVEKKLADADAMADELQAAVAKADEFLRKIVKARGELLPVLMGDAHVNAAALSADGCALAPAAIVQLLKYEIYRTGARPISTGLAGIRSEISFPGGVSPRIEFQHQPERITPLATTLRRASAYAVALLRGENGVSAPLDLPTEQPAQPPAPPAPPTETRHSLLLKRLEVLSNPGKEAEYLSVVRELSELTEGA